MLTFYGNGSGMPTGKVVTRHIDFVRRNRNRIVEISVYETNMYGMFEDEFASGTYDAMVVIKMDNGSHGIMGYGSAELARLFASFYLAHASGGVFSAACGDAQGKRYDHYTAYATRNAYADGTWKQRRKLLSNV